MGKYRALGSLLDRVFRNDLNANFVDVEKDIKEMSEKFTNAVDLVSGEAFGKIVAAAKIDWLPPVNTFSDLSTTYPNAVEGKTAMVRDSGKVYRFNGTDWIEIQSIDVGPLNELESRLNLNLAQRSINVRQPPYNLKADGTDETVLLQSLLNVAKTNGGVTLYFPKGVYGVSGHLRLYANTTIILDKEATIKRLGSVNKVFINGELGNSAYATAYNGEGNIHFIGGAIDLNHETLAPDKTLSAFDLAHGENISFVDFTIKNGQIGHYFQISGCKNIRFKDCWFGDVAQTSTASANYELMQIEATSSASFPTFGEWDLTISKDIYIENCHFENVIRAIGTHSDGKYGTNDIIYCENIQIRGCTFKNSYDSMLNLTAFKDSKIVNNVIDGVAGFGIYLLEVKDSLFSGNTVKNAVKSGLQSLNSAGNKYSKNYWLDTCLSTTSAYSVLRLSASSDNTFEDETIDSEESNYSYAFYSSGGAVGNKIINHRFAQGKTALIGGESSAEITNIQIGNGQEVLFDGDISTINVPVTLSEDIRLFNFLVVIGNDNSSATASLVTMVIPKIALIIGSATSRFKLVTDDSNATDRVLFSFPTTKTLQADEISGTCHIRKVIGFK